ESPELKAIRDSILLARTAEICRFPAEIPWFVTTIIAAKNAIMNIWLTEADHRRAAALATAVLELRSHPEDWVDRWEGEPPPNWVETNAAASVAGLSLPVELNGAELITAYNEWLEQELLEPLRLRSPAVYRLVVEQVMSFIDGIAEEGNGEDTRIL